MLGTTAAGHSGAPGELQPACTIPIPLNNSRAGSAVLPKTWACVATTAIVTKHSAVVMTQNLTWMVSQASKGPQHIFNALGGKVRQLVHQLPLQHLEQHGTRVVVQ